jgi:hypothetical protein
MIKTSIKCIAVLFVAILSINTHAHGVSEENIKEGKILLQSGKKNLDDNQAIQIGKNVAIMINPYIDDFGDKKVINANGKFINQTDETQEVIYLITVYDAENKLVGASVSKFPVPAKMTTWIGDALIRGKEEDFKKVTSYRIYLCSFTKLEKE